MDEFTRIEGIELNGDKRGTNYHDLPDECPVCHRKVHPKMLGAFTNDCHDLQIVFRCTGKTCQRVFVGIYREETPTGLNYLDHCVPMTPVERGFGKEISALSPSFVNIYNQAIAAEAYGLTEIVGVGLRKALEFLIKDYAIWKNPADKPAILKTLLSPCINTYVADTNIKQCAEKATWLGNDETHYVRIWSDKDIKDLKILIELTVNWTRSVILTEKYMAEMQR